MATEDNRQTNGNLLIVEALEGKIQLIKNHSK